MLLNSFETLLLANTIRNKASSPSVSGFILRLILAVKKIKEPSEFATAALKLKSVSFLLI